jgi:hypothetical protein
MMSAGMSPPPPEGCFPHSLERLSPSGLEADLISKPFVFPDFCGKRVLVLGVGGGCDIISAFAVAEILKPGGPAKLIYANTKTRVWENLQRVSRHILRVPAERIVLSAHQSTHGTTLIDQSMPRGDDGCPLILELPPAKNHCEELAREIQQMTFDVILSVDTGADSIVAETANGPCGRDQRMMAVLERVGRPWFHLVVSPGCDGETSLSQLEAAVRKLIDADKYAGYFPIAPLLPTMRKLAAPLGRTRTPNIIIDAFSGVLESSSDGQALVVPRGLMPVIPRSWLTMALVFCTL